MEITQILTLGYDVNRPRSGVARVIQACRDFIDINMHTVDASDIEPANKDLYFFQRLQERYLKETISFLNNRNSKECLVYAHHFCSNKALEYAKNLGAHVIFHCHGIRYQHFKHEIIGYRESPQHISVKLSASDIEYIIHEMEYADRIERQCFSIADTIITPSLLISDDYIAKPKKVKKIPSVLPSSYVELLLLTNKKRKFKKDKPVQINIGYCGRLEYAKGFDRFQNFSKEYANYNIFSFHVAGPNYWGFRLDGNIKYHGWLSDSKLVDFFNQIDILIMPSRYEPFGLVALEALLAGCRVVASNEVISMLFANGHPGIRIISDFTPSYLFKTVQDIIMTEVKFDHSLDIARKNNKHLEELAHSLKFAWRN